MFCYTPPIIQTDVYYVLPPVAANTTNQQQQQQQQQQQNEIIPLNANRRGLTSSSNNPNNITSGTTNNSNNNINNNNNGNGIVPNGNNSTYHGGPLGKRTNSFSLIVNNIDMDSSFSPPNVNILRDCFDADYEAVKKTGSSSSSGISGMEQQQQQQMNNNNITTPVSVTTKSNATATTAAQYYALKQQQQQQQQSSSSSTTNSNNSDKSTSTNTTATTTTTPQASNTSSDATNKDKSSNVKTATSNNNNNPPGDQNYNKKNKNSKNGTIVFIRREVELKRRVSELTQRTGKKQRVIAPASPTSIISSSSSSSLTTTPTSPTMENNNNRFVHVYMPDTNKQITIQISQQTRGIDLIQQATAANYSHSFYNPATANAIHFSLHVASENRYTPTVDSSFPVLDAQTPILNLGVTNFMLIPKRASVSKTSGIIGRTSRLLQERGRGTLEDVILEVYKGNISSLLSLEKPCLVHVAPDLLFRDLPRVLSYKFDVDEKKFTIYLIKDGKQRPLPKHYRDRTFRSLQGVIQIAFLRTTEEEVPASPVGGPNNSLNPTLNEEDMHNDLVIPFDVDSLAYQEFRVIKTNKFGVRQERKLGIDSQKIYNLKPNSITSFLGISSQKTKHPERPLESLSAVTPNPDNPKAFTLDFNDGETLYYETKTTVEGLEIIKRLRYLLRVKRQEQNDSLLRRRSISIMALNKPSNPPR